MPLGPFRRRKKDADAPPKPEQLQRAKPPSVDLPAGEMIERSIKATLLQGTTKVNGALYLTNRRLMFESEKGEARWMIVPFDEMREAGLYRWHHAPMGRSSLNQCLCVVTTKGEQVWWDFDEHAEREWVEALQRRIASTSLEDADA